MSSSHQQRFERYLRGEMRPDEVDAFEAQLVNDDALMLAFEEFAKNDGASISSEQMGDAPKNFTRAVKQRINRRSGGRFFVEDIVSSRFIPWFIAGSFALIAAVVVVGRKDVKTPVAEAVVEETVTPNRPSASQGLERLPNANTVANNPPHMEAIQPRNTTAVRGEVSGQATANLQYVASVPIITTKLRKEELRVALVERFGEERILEREDHFGVRVRAAELGEGVNRALSVGGELSEESMEISYEELDYPVLQVKWR